MHQKSNSSLLVISGVHKAGTTSLFRYLSKHSLINPAVQKETHFFTPIRFKKEPGPISSYHALFPDQPATKYRLEASPSYLYGGAELGKALSSAAEEVKTISILRNPSDRFVSFYKHGKYTLDLDQNLTFQAFLEQSEQAASETLEDNRVSRGIREGFYIDYLPEWDALFGENHKIIFFDDLIQSPEKTVMELFDWLKLPREVISGIGSAENKTGQYKNRSLHRFSMKVNHSLQNFFLKNARIKNGLKGIYNLINGGKNTEPISVPWMDRLDRIYTLKNKELRIYLQESKKMKNFPEWLQ